MNLDDAENKLYNSEEIAKPVKLFTLSEADKMNKYTFKPFDYDVRSDFSKGVSVGVGELADIPQEVVLFGKRARLALGGYFGDTPEEFENKRVNLITAERNLLEAKQNRMLENKVSPEASESLSFSIGSNIPTFATMLLGASAAYRGVRAISTAEKAIGAAGKIGLAENFLFEGASEVAKKTPTVSKTDERIKTGEARAGELDVDKITKEWAAKSTLDVPLYAAVSTYLEAKVGFGEQLNIWNTPIKLSGTTKNIVARALAKTGVTVASEGTTETLQSLSSTGINLIDGTITPKDLPEELQEAVMSGIVGGIMGTASGGSVSLKQARNAISMIRQQIEPVVGKENAQVVAESLFNDASTDLSNIVTRELELDSQLRNKHGNVWNSMLTAVTKEMEGKPRFEGWSEDQKAHYANTVAKHFADQTLAEANFRGTTLDAILRASDITWNKGIRLARHINLFDALKNPEMIPAQTKLKRESLLAFLKRNGGLQDYGGELKSRDAQKLYPGIVNKNGMNFDDAALMAWKNGYFPSKTERPDINEFLEVVDEELRGNHRYNTEEERNFSDAIEDLREELDRLGIDYENMTAAEIEKAVDEIPELKSLEREAAFYEQYEPEIGLSEDETERFAMKTEGKQYPVIEDKDLPEYYQIADENAQLDAENPAYDGETITINGKERTVYNSNGDRIAQSKEALENFYNWFGDSKVVDEQGRPLVVYHGSKASNIEVFDVGLGTNGLAYGSGVYFSRNKILAESNYGKNVYNVYLRERNPFFDNSSNSKEMEKLFNVVGEEYKDGYTISKITNKNEEQTYKAKEITKALKSMGYDGVIFGYNNNPAKGIEYVAFEPNQIKSTQNRGTYSESENIYYQKAQGSTKITPDEYIIKLLESADESTLPHEFAHYWLTEMWNYTRTGRASENYMKRWNIISDYLGIKPEQTRLTRGQQEKFASSYEAYLTRGELPTPLIGSVFDDYDKWLQQVYNDYNKINYQSGFGKRRVRLTDAAIKFFQSMTTGTLEAPALAPKNTGVAIPEKTEEVIKPTNEVVETPATYDTTRVVNITEGKKGVSKVFQREAMKHADRIVDELGVSYNKINLEEQAVKASEWVQNNLEEARKVVNGAPAPEGIIDTAIFIAYENEMLRIGNNAEYQRALKIHSQVQTQRGQAIAAERITTDDVYNPAYWWKKLQKSQETNVARKLFKGDTDALKKVVETETKNLMKQIAGKPRDEQVKALSNLAEKLQKDYNLDTLYQMPDEVNERTVKEFVKDTLGVNPDVMTGNEVINKAEQLQKLWDNTKDESGNPSVEAMRAKRELNDLIQAQNPSSTLAIWTSIFGRGVMLASVKSPVLNIISNIEAGLTEGITRRIMYKTTEKAVDANVKEEFSNYAWEVYKASGDIVPTMNDYDDDMRVIGEQILHSQGQGAFRAASRKVEEISFKYLMGAPDAVSKTLAFNDTADLLATKIAREEGAKDISKRATEIYKDAILIKPQTEQGQLVRQKAQEQAHYTTFTNDSWAARFGLSARNWLNMVGRNKVRLGDLTMKFVKTPANVQMMGLEYGFGSLYTLYNVQEVIKNPQSQVSQHAIRAAVRNGLGIALAALLYSMLDPEDYFSEFDTLNPKEKDRMRAMGAMPNSIKIGNRWVSLDYFGQIAIPLVGMLEARRNDGLRSYIQSGLTQAAKIPGIKETKQLIDTMSEYARYDLKPEKIVQMMAGTVLDQARAMTIPAIVNDIAKMTDDYERDTMGGVFDKVFASIPGLRQTLPERYGIQGLVRTEPALSTLLFGSRVKTEQSDKLVREVEKLAGKAEQPSISDVTKYGDLRLLSPEKKVKVRKEFYKLYNSESKKLISTREYQKKSPEDKKKALNKVRSRVVKSLKEKYSNDIQREKRRQ